MWSKESIQTTVLKKKKKNKSQSHSQRRNRMGFLRWQQHWNISNSGLCEQSHILVKEESRVNLVDGFECLFCVHGLKEFWVFSEFQFCCQCPGVKKTPQLSTGWPFFFEDLGSTCESPERTMIEASAHHFHKKKVPCGRWTKNPCLFMTSFPKFQMSKKKLTCWVSTLLSRRRSSRKRFLLVWIVPGQQPFVFIWCVAVHWETSRMILLKNRKGIAYVKKLLHKIKNHSPELKHGRAMWLNVEGPTSFLRNLRDGYRWQLTQIQKLLVTQLPEKLQFCLPTVTYIQFFLRPKHQRQLQNGLIGIHSNLAENLGGKKDFGDKMLSRGRRRKFNGSISVLHDSGIFHFNNFPFTASSHGLWQPHLSGFGSHRRKCQIPCNARRKRNFGTHSGQCLFGWVSFEFLNFFFHQTREKFWDGIPRLLSNSQVHLDIEPNWCFVEKWRNQHALSTPILMKTSVQENISTNMEYSWSLLKW